MSSKEFPIIPYSIMGIATSILLSLFVLFFVHPEIENNQGISLPSGISMENQRLQDMGITPIISPKIEKASALGENFQDPLHLSIPRISLHVDLEKIGLTQAGEMDVPKSRKNAGWYELGPRPGNRGNALIDGHYGVWKDGTIGVFNNLATLQKGDKILIEDTKGTTITFIVRALRIYHIDQDTSDIFTTKDNTSHLNLITCYGTWDKNKKTYSSRLVVFTDKTTTK